MHTLTRSMNSGTRASAWSSFQDNVVGYIGEDSELPGKSWLTGLDEENIRVMIVEFD